MGEDAPLIFPHVSDVLRAELLTFTLADELLQLAEREPE